MAVLKAQQADAAARSALVLDLGDLHAQGQRIIEHAKQQAEQIVAEGKQTRAQLIADANEVGHREGYNQGHAEGHEQGLREGTEQAFTQVSDQLQHLSAAWAQSLDTFNSARVQMLRDAQHAVLGLAVAIAEKVTHRVVELDPTIVQDQLDAVLSAITTPSALVIEVHPDDLETAQRALPELIDRTASLEHVELTTSDAIARGSCVARTRSVTPGRIDASIDAQLTRIIDTLLPRDADHAASPGSEPDDTQPNA